MKNLKSILVLFISIFLLASCNVNPSTSTNSSVNGNVSSSSVISSSVATGNLSAIEISTTSSTNLFVGITQRVVINANLVGNSTIGQLDWYLDDVRSTTQSGLSFEFFPTVVRTYKVYAQVGNVKSNELTFNLDLPSFTIQNFRINNASNIQLVGDSGYSFSLGGISVATTSSYNIANRTYNLNLLTPLIQGTSYNLLISKGGFKDLIYPFTFDNRLLEVGYILYQGKKVDLNAQGVYQLSRPFTSSANYTVSLKHRNLDGTNVAFSMSTSVPPTATPIATIQETKTVQRDINIDTSITLTSTSVTGLYAHSFNVGGRTISVNIQVLEALPRIILDTPVVFDEYDLASMSTPYATDAAGEYINDLAEINASGQYIVYRPYNGDKFALTYRVKAENFATPTGLTGNQFFLRSAVVGPVGAAIFYDRTISSATPNTMPAEINFANATTMEIVHYIDGTTDLGTYTYTFTVFGATAPVSRSIVVIVKEFLPSIAPNIIYNGVELKPNSDGSYTMFKPIGNNPLSASIGVLVKYYESPKFPTPQSNSGDGLDTRYDIATKNTTPSQEYRWLLNFAASYSGPLSRIPMATKLGLQLGETVTTPNTSEIDTVVSVGIVADYPRYKSDGVSAVLNLNNILDLTNYPDSTNIFTPLTSITSSTFPGTHTFRVQVGKLATNIVIRVEEPRPLILLKDDSVRYGFTSVSEDNVTFNKTTNKYLVNGVNGTLAIDVYPFGMPTGNYPFTFTITKPNGQFQSTTNIVNLVLADPYDGTLVIPENATGSEMIVRTVLDQEGEYTLSYTINNQIQIFSIVVLAAPQLRVETIQYNEVALNRSVDNFYLLRSDTARFLDIVLKPVNIEDTYEYVLSTTGVFPTGEALVAAKRQLSTSDGFIRTGVEIAVTPGAATSEHVDSVYIALYDGNRIVGEITRIFIVSRPVAFSTIYFYTFEGTTVAPVTRPVGTAAFDLSNLSTRTNFNLTWHLDPERATQAISNTFTFPASDTILYAKWTTP